MPDSGQPSAVPDLEAAPQGANSASLRPTFDTTRWQSFLLPSVSDLIFVLLLISLSAGSLAQKLLGDAGIGWHIRTGDLILRSGEVPRVDPFSSTMGGKPWYAWEWLYDVVVAMLHRGTGLNGVVFFTAWVIAFTFLLVFRRMLARGAGLGIAVGMLLLAVSASSIHFLTRPHVLSWLLTIMWFGVLQEFEEDGKSRRLWCLPVMMLAWVNLHGGFLVGFVLLGIYFLAEWERSWAWSTSAGREAEGRKAKALAVVGAGAALVTLANPYGYRLHVHIYSYLTDRFLMDHIDEFLSPNFHGLPQKCFLIIVLLTTIGATCAPKKLSASELMVVVFSVYSGLYAARNIPVSSILLILIVGPRLSSALKGWPQARDTSGKVGRAFSAFNGFEQRTANVESGLRGHWLPILFVLLGIWVCLHEGRFGAHQIMAAHFDGKRFPVHAASWLSENGVHDSVFCPDSWGGYMIYRWYPEIRVVVDDRHDLYGAEYLKQYLKFMHAEPGWDEALAETHADWVLLPDGTPAATLLREVAAWKIVYRDQTAVVFKRATK
jgi:hypothetical protein